MKRKKDKRVKPSPDPIKAARAVFDFVVEKTENPSEAVVRTGIIVTPTGWRIPTEEEAKEMKMLSQQATRGGIILPAPE